MAYDYTNRVTKDDIHAAALKSLGARLSNEDIQRLNRDKNNWNFYDGFHWEKLAKTDKPEVTVNYVRAFVDKFVAFEMGNGFTIKMKPFIEQIDDANDPLVFLNEVWGYNNKEEKSVELGQSKSITGNGWIQVSYEPKFIKGKPNPNFIDPFDEFEKGRIKITILPDSICFPVYSSAHDKDHLEKFVVMYPFTKNVTPSGSPKSPEEKTVLYKQEWTAKEVKIFMEDMMTPTATLPNKYGVIPFRQIKNFPQQGRNDGISDIEDIIPINTEINLKKSDISEIIDYHSAPVTVVFGARIGQLERGANKVWGGLPKDARIENLRLEGDLMAAQNYITELKKAMHEVGNIPEGVLGGTLAISNTSGVALQIALMPLLERVKVKQVQTKTGLEWVNKLILLIAEKEGLLTIPKEVTYNEGEKTVTKKITRSDYFHNEVHFESILPKDTLLEIQELELEMKMGLESREGAMKRRGKENIQERIREIDDDMQKNPKLYGKDDVQEQIEMMKEQAKIQKDNAPATPKSNEKPVGTNKEGKPKQVNAGFQNSPKPKN